MWSFGQKPRSPPPMQRMAPSPMPTDGSGVFALAMPAPSVPTGPPPAPFQPIGLPSPPTSPTAQVPGSSAYYPSPAPSYNPPGPPPQRPTPASALTPAPGTDPNAFPGGFGMPIPRDARARPAPSPQPPPPPPPPPQQQQQKPAHLRRPAESAPAKPPRKYESQAELRPRPAPQVAEAASSSSKKHRLTQMLVHQSAPGASRPPPSTPAPAASPAPARPAPAQPRLSHEGSGSGFSYSTCRGRKRALCIGINYTGTSRELYGCVNDAHNVRKWLIKHHGFDPKEILFLVDGPNAKESQLPTRARILNAMRWLVKDAHQNDSLFFHYSGHGAQTKDKDGDEPDGFDEVIFPLDYKHAGYIIDDDMHILMVRPLPEGCRLTALFDSCHSGSALDLPYLYHSDGRVKQMQVTRKAFNLRRSCADVISFSACKDSETSADTYENGEAVGAMSYAFMLCLNRTPDVTYQELLKAIRRVLRDKYSQKPQLSSSHRIDTNLKFII